MVVDHLSIINNLGSYTLPSLSLSYCVDLVHIRAVLVVSLG